MNHRNLVLAPRARQDLDDIATFTEKQWGITRRNDYLSNLIDTLDQLRKAPELGRRLDDTRDELHSFPTGRLIFFYRFDAENLAVVRALHLLMEPESH